MKKYGVLVGIVLFLALAIFVNARINEKVGAENANTTPVSKIEIEGVASAETAQMGGANYFDAFRIDRKNNRDIELEYIDAIVQDNKTDAETLLDAQQRKLTIVDNIEKEFTIESLLKSKGFEDAAVILHKGSVNVVLKAEKLEEKQVSQVLEIVCRETGEPAQSVKISLAKE